uniref:Secreted protein n=1 Tax=Globodera pallida TaxID=36090 RepID=A0A183BZK6_GLOPA
MPPNILFTGWWWYGIVMLTLLDVQGVQLRTMTNEHNIGVTAWQIVQGTLPPLMSIRPKEEHTNHRKQAFQEDEEDTLRELSGMQFRAQPKVGQIENGEWPLKEQ